MKIIIDTDVCKKKDYDVGTILYLASLLSSCPITLHTFENARQKGLLKFEEMYDRNKPFPEAITLSKTGEYILNSVISASSSKKGTEAYYELANRMRALYPDGNKPGYPYKWRDSTEGIAERLQSFFAKYPQCAKYSDDEIVEATKSYVNSFNGDYKYMQLLKYFIWKNKTTGGELERQAQLAAWLQDKQEEKQINHDWEVKLC